VHYADFHLTSDICDWTNKVQEGFIYQNLTNEKLHKLQRMVQAKRMKDVRKMCAKFTFSEV
jgi:hypothetical protein